jgi:hypothetical protein
MSNTVYFQPPGIRAKYCEIGMISDTDPDYVWYLDEPCKILLSEVKLVPEENVIYDKKKRLYIVKNKQDMKETDHNGDPLTYWGGLEEPKQGTLEEVATKEGLYRCSQNNFNQAEAGYNAKWFKRGALFGAKWQQEQIGKSEFLQRLRATISDAEARRLIFEQFKNK